jgi:hypothetical protein
LPGDNSHETQLEIAAASYNATWMLNKAKMTANVRDRAIYKILKLLLLNPAWSKDYRAAIHK